MMHAYFNTLEYALQQNEYVHFSLISGQDLPIKNLDEFYDYLIQNKDLSCIDIATGEKILKRFQLRNVIYYPNFMLKRKYIIRAMKKIYVTFMSIFIKKKIKKDTSYFGSFWISLSYDYAKYLLEINKNESIVKKFRHASNPDESMIHTIFMNSNFKNMRLPYYTYVDWSEGKSSPRVLTMDDYDKIMSSDKFFARKFSQEIDNEIILKILDTIK